MATTRQEGGLFSNGKRTKEGQTLSALADGTEHDGLLLQILKEAARLSVPYSLLLL